MEDKTLEQIAMDNRAVEIFKAKWPMYPAHNTNSKDCWCRPTVLSFHASQDGGMR
jgi:hypothetical protein